MKTTAQIEADATRIVQQLGGKWQGRYAMARCPAHNDRNPSLMISIGEKAVLFTCFAGCSGADVAKALPGRNAPRLHEDKPKSKTAALNKLALSIWRAGKPIEGTIAQVYLEARCIPAPPLQMRFTPRTQIGSGADKQFHPALLLPVHDDTGIVSIQRICLAPDGRGKADIEEPKRGLGDHGGGAIMLGARPVDGHLRLAEGFEDAASVVDMLPDRPPIWAVMGVRRYGVITIPETIRHISIYSQHGPEAAAAIKGAHDYLTANNRTLEIIPPPTSGTDDWNDYRRKGGTLGPDSELR